MLPVSDVPSPAPLTLEDLDRPGLPGNPGLRLAVLGHPIRHSLSPELHHGALAVLAKSEPRFGNWRYLRFDVPPERLPEALPRLHAAGFLGLNLTVPHKVIAAGLLHPHAIDEAARPLGAVNTLHRTAEGWEGRNTDGYGLATALAEDLGSSFEGADVILIGAGGAARSAAVEAASRGCSSLLIGNRTLGRARELAGTVRALAPAIRTDAFDLATPPPLPAGALVIQCTSLGLSADDALPIDPAALPEGARIYEMIYRPSETPFLAAARARGCRGASGLGMLIHQAARALEWWTGRPIPVDAMRQAVHGR